MIRLPGLLRRQGQDKMGERDMGRKRAGWVEQEGDCVREKKMLEKALEDV